MIIQKLVFVVLLVLFFSFHFHNGGKTYTDYTFLTKKHVLLHEGENDDVKFIYSLHVKDLETCLSLVSSKENCNILYIDKERGLMIVEMSHMVFKTLSSHILQYDFRSHLPSEESFLSDFDYSINAVQLAKLRFPGYFQAIPLISLKENDVSPDDIDLLGRSFPSEYSSGKETNHANNMATIIAGKGNTFHSSTGILENALISTTSFLNLFPDDISYFQENGITIQNHSYGLEVEDYYGLEANYYDGQVYENPNILHVFSSGNRGNESAIFSPYSSLDAYSNLTGTFKHAKNVLTVGAIDSFDNLSSNSSIGPAYDGRIKPELVAYGYSGTSESAAIVTGCSAVIENALITEGFDPDAASIKACLVTGADDVGTLGPDFETGFGRINLNKSLQIVKSRALFQDSIASQEMREFKLEFNSANPHYKVALVWTDPPAEIDNNRALINDLDIEVLDEEDNIYYPFQVKYLPSEITNGTPFSYGRDSINNVELIEIEDAKTDLLIRIKSKNILNGQQKFSVAVSNECDNCFDFNFPFMGSNVEGLKAFRSTFTSFCKAQVSLLEYKAKGQQEYNVALDANQLRAFKFPDTSGVFSGYALNESGISAETEFTVSSVPNLRPAWQCGDSVMITWDQSPFQKEFQLLELVAGNMEVVDSTTENHFVLNRRLSAQFVSVREKIDDGYYGHGSLAFDLQAVNLNCYYKQFFFREVDGGLELNLNLEASNFIKEIVFEKWIGESFRPIVTFNNIELNLKHTDVELLEGNNRYRAVIKLQNNQLQYSENVIYLNVLENQILVFPTLVNANEGIQIIQGKFQPLVFNLFDSSGRNIIEEELFSDYDYIDTFCLPKGIYFYSLKNGKKILKSGRLIVTSQ